MKRTYSTREASERLGISFRTINRWLSLGRIRPSHGTRLSDGRVLWRWTPDDVRRAKQLVGKLKPGPKAGSK